MANTLTPIIRKIISDTQAVLRGSGALFNAVTMYAGAEGAGKGQTIQLPLPTAQTAYDITPGVTPPALNDTTVTAATLIMDQSRGSKFHLTGEEVKKIEAGEFVGTQIQEAIKVLIDGAENYLWGVMSAGAGLSQGVAATDPFATNPDIVMDCWKDLFDAKAPLDGNWMITGGKQWASLGKLDQFQKLNEAPRGTDFSTAMVGMLGNFETAPTQVIVDSADIDNIYANKAGTVMAIRPAGEPNGGDMAVDRTVITDPVTGISMRLAEYKGYHASQYELSITYGASVQRANLVGVLKG
jgi:hypothetical protein